MSELKERLKQKTPFKSEVADWDGDQIEVRSMSLAEKTALTEGASKNGDLILSVLMPRLIVATCFDPATGEKLFNEEDVDWINEQNAGVIESVASVGIRLSGLGAEALNDAKKDS